MQDCTSAIPSLLQKHSPLSKYTVDTVTKIIQALESGYSRRRASIMAGVSYPAVRTWIVHYSDFRHQVEEAEKWAERFDRKRDKAWKYNATTAKTITDAIANGLRQSAACELAGVSFGTVTEWMRAYPDFCAQVIAARAAAKAMRLEKARQADQIKKLAAMTGDDYMAIHEEQSGACAICGGISADRSMSGGIRRLAIDHCHISGKVRGLLCHKCNTGIGLFNDDPELLQAAIDYLAKKK